MLFSDFPTQKKKQVQLLGYPQLWTPTVNASIKVVMNGPLPQLKNQVRGRAAEKNRGEDENLKGQLEHVGR